MRLIFTTLFLVAVALAAPVSEDSVVAESQPVKNTELAAEKWFGWGWKSSPPPPPKKMTLAEGLAKFGACEIKDANLHYQAVGINALMRYELLYDATKLAQKRDGLGHNLDGKPFKRIQHVLVYLQFKQECAGTTGIVVAHDQNIVVMDTSTAKALETGMSKNPEYNDLTYNGKKIIPYEHGFYLPSYVAAKDPVKFGCLIHNLLLTEHGKEDIEAYHLFKQNCANFARQLFLTYLYGPQWLKGGKVDAPEFKKLWNKGMKDNKLGYRMQNSDIMKNAMYDACTGWCGGKTRVDADLAIIGMASNSPFTNDAITPAIKKKAASFCH